MISYAKQDGNTVRVYNERNSQIFAWSGTLVGYTNTSVSIKQGSTVRVYDERGSQISSYSA